MKNVLPYLAPALLLFSSCTQYAYYQSPFQTNTSTYRTQPLVKDSARSAIYATGVWTTGGANFRLRDAVNGMMGSLYRSHTGDHFQAYYGISGGLGVYDANDYDRQDLDFPNNKNLNDSLLNLHSGSKFFAGIGAVGGVNLVLPYQRSEWRVIGVEASWIREFGHYMNFRKSLPDTAANLIDRRQNYVTIGLNTDMVFYRRHGSAGYKVAVVWLLRNLQVYDANRKSTTVTPAYFSQTYHFTNGRVTGQVQFNLGYRSLSLLAGVNYQLSK